MHQFNEHHPEFKGFSEYFHSEIAPKLSEREGDRGEALARTHLWGSVAAAIVGAIAFAFAWSRPELDQKAYLFVYVIALPFFAYQLVRRILLRQVSRHTKSTLVRGVFEFLGWSFQPEIKDFDHSAWVNAHLVPMRRIIAKSFEDYVSGEAHGATFQSVEAKLERQSGRSRKTVFQGQLMWLTFDRPLGMGRTVVIRDKGVFNMKNIGMKRVGLVDPVFERIFEAYSTDQVGARVVLDPAFMQRMVDLETYLNGGNIRFAFEDQTVLIAVETSNRYEAGSMSSRLDDPARAQRILNEVGAIFDIVDTLFDRTRKIT
ncbi:MAG: DUF3137 domain-containing protein [Pseudomonadota bacterium]